MRWRCWRRLPSKLWPLPDITLADIGAIVVNTITGLAIPSLEARLVNRLPFSRQVERLPIFGLGCGGGVGGLARAVRMAETMPGGHVLFLTVDLCSLCARGNDMSVANFVSIALFGDGAAAVVLRNTRGGNGLGRPRGRIMAIGEHCWPDTEYIMGWDIKDNGFGVVLSPELPSLMRGALRPAVDEFLARNDLEPTDIKGILMHPGGRRVLDTAQAVLGLSKRDSSTPGRCCGSTATCRRRRRCSSWSARCGPALAGRIC